MLKKYTLGLFFFITTTSLLFSQIEEQKKQLPSVAIGVGMITFDGDVGSGVNLSSFSRIRGAYSLTVEQRIKNLIGVSFTGTFGKMADSESGKISRLNFETKITQVELGLVLHLDNGFIFERNSSFAPYLFGGIGFLKFDPHGDLMSAKGIKYNYWTDGTIRDLAESDPNATNAVIIQRDYNFETQLKDSATNYSRSTLVIPFGAGVTLKLNDNLGVNLALTYNLALSDWIDNFRVGSNDKYLFGCASLKYTFGKTDHDNSAAQYKSIDFSDVDKTDVDGDGVADGNDKCPGTPKGYKVNSKGCPDDDDEDGVVNELDKEPKTKRGSLVNEQGITVTDADIAKKQAAWDSLATERNQLFN